MENLRDELGETDVEGDAEDWAKKLNEFGIDEGVSDRSPEKPSLDPDKTRSYTRVQTPERHVPGVDAETRRLEHGGEARGVSWHDGYGHSGVRARAPEPLGPDVYAVSRNKRVATRLLGTSMVLFGVTAGFLWKTQEFNREYRFIRSQAENCHEPTDDERVEESDVSEEEPPETDTNFESTAVVQTFTWKKSPVVGQQFFNAKLEVVIPDGGFGQTLVRDVVPAYQQQVTIVNLWASWCGPCRDEMKMFSAMLEKKLWGDEVAFVAINTLEEGNLLPHAAYRKIENTLPKIAHRLTDRSYKGRDIFDPLRAKNAKLKKVEKGKDVALPITLVFDCRQRIRWAKFAPLEQHDVDGTQPESMARVIGELVAEFPMKRCQRPPRPRITRPLGGDSLSPINLEDGDDPQDEDSGVGGETTGGVPEPPREIQDPPEKTKPVIQQPKKPEPKGPFCGDGSCDLNAGEDCRSCSDCACSGGFKCSDDKNPKCVDPGLDL